MRQGRTTRHRVVLCVQNLPVPDDPRVWREARDLAAAGYDVHVVCPRGAGQPAREVLEQVEIHRYRQGPELAGVVGQVVETVTALAATAVKVVGLRLRGRIDVLHAANPPDTFFLVGLLLRPFGTRFVFDQHDVSPELLSAKLGHRPMLDRVLRLLERGSYRSAHLVVAPNLSYRELAIGRGGKQPEDVVVVRSGPDEVGPADRVDLPTPAVLVFAGAIDSQDGVHLLIEAAAEILERRPGAVRVDLIGTGDNVDALRALAQRLGIDEAVTFAGWLQRAELHRRLRRATIAVSPDPDNAFTRVSTMTKVTDYLGLGMPCVVADLPENRATGGDAVVYFPPGDGHALAKAIEQLLDDPELHAEYASRARDRAPMLLWAHSRDRLLSAYETLLSVRDIA